MRNKMGSASLLTLNIQKNEKECKKKITPIDEAVMGYAIATPHDRLHNIEKRLGRN